MNPQRLSASRFQSPIVPETRVSGSTRRPTTLEAAAVLYLLFPVVIFLIGWLKPAFAALAVGLLAPSIAGLWKHRYTACSSNIPSGSAGSWRTLWQPALVAFAIAAIWVSLSGLAGGFSLNKDWTVRLSALRDLTAGAWPLSYGFIQDGTHESILRFPMSYFLPASVLGKIFGWKAAQLGLWAWTTLGTWIFLILALASSKSQLTARKTIFIVLFVILFSGLDIIGHVITWGYIPAFGEHIEWWATGAFQYSSNTTLLFWVPNHALPGWIAAAIAWRHRSAGLSVRAAVPLLLAVFAWAPLVAVGLAPLLVMVTLRGIGLRVERGDSQHIRSTGRLWSLTLLLPVGWFLAVFVTMGNLAPVEPQSLEFLTSGWLTFIFFAVFEWGLFYALARRMGCNSPLLTLACIELLALPLLHFGPGNDIVMRGGIPAITIVMFAVLSSFERQPDAPDARHHRALVALSACLVLGAVTPLLEIQRAFMPSHIRSSEGENFIAVNGAPWHYVGTLDSPLISQVLRTPVRLQAAPNPSTPTPREFLSP